MVKCSSLAQANMGLKKHSKSKWRVHPQNFMKSSSLTNCLLEEEQNLVLFSPNLDVVIANFFWGSMPPDPSKLVCVGTLL